MPDAVQLAQSLVSGGLVVGLIYGLVAIAGYPGTEAAHA
jgi:hypothetical protein